MLGLMGVFQTRQSLRVRAHFLGRELVKGLNV